MPFVQEILGYRSISVVGLGKNTGKTECLNYILNRLPAEDFTVAVSSAGIDGEVKDQVTGTVKPEIFLREGTLFATSEKHYRERKILSELLDISYRNTSLGRVVTARALAGGKSQLSGHPSTKALKMWIDRATGIFGANLAIIDGALSRVSIASPAITEGLVLATGAALSVSMDNLVFKTSYMVSLINMERTSLNCADDEFLPTSGIWRVDKCGEFNQLVKGGVFAAGSIHPDDLVGASAIFVSGALTDRFLNQIRTACIDNNIELIIRDFTNAFISHSNYISFTRAGGKLRVLNKSKLIAVCANPVSPEGFKLDSELLCEKLSLSLKLPVYDIRRIQNEA
ncbi:MAG: hypothetical protein PHV12_04010 [Bacteroidales bacterium]|jgi:hypothetical protein|nr:hypothetical protein [Bacteroidales bacterium]MDD3272467.1 hypothetical protein [Bacteroidales bacterium]